MTNPLFSIFSGVLICHTLTSAEVDTIVLKQTDFAFPLTHPGQMFTIKKAIIDSGPGVLKKSATVPDSLSSKSSGTGIQPSPTFEMKDVLGRALPQQNSKQLGIKLVHQLPLSKSAANLDSIAPKRIGTNRFQPRGQWKSALLSTSSLIKTSRDLVEMEKAERIARIQSNGALLSDFAKKMETKSSSDSFEALISLKIESPGFLNKFKHSEAEMRENSRKWAHPKTLLRKEDLLIQYGLKEIGSELFGENGRILHVKTTKAKILELAKVNEIAEIGEYHSPKPLTVPGGGPPPFESLISSAYNPTEVPMQNYTGVNTATLSFDTGVRPSFISCIADSLKPVSYYYLPGYPQRFTPHDEGVQYVLSAGTVGNNRYVLGFYGFDDSIPDYDIRSFSLSYETAYSDTEYGGRYWDFWAYRYPYPTITLAAGDSDLDSVAIGQSYNVLNVGDVQHYDNSHFIIDARQADTNHCPPAGLACPGSSYIPLTTCSQARNPHTKYGSTADRELPYIVAPGITPDPWWGMQNSCVIDTPLGYLGRWTGECGTSLSAPVLNAMATNVIGATYYTSSPEKTRAALLVTAQNVDSGYWDPANHDGRDGAGTVSGASAVNFVTHASIASPNDDPYEIGLGEGYMDSAAIVNFEVQYYQYLTPSTIDTTKHLRIVLTWDSSPGTNVSQNELSDLGLYACTDNGCYNSDSWNGNVEMLDIPDSVLTPSNAYGIFIYPWTYRAASDGPNFTNYSIAWTWVKNHAD